MQFQNMLWENLSDGPVGTGPSDSHPPECVIPDGVLIQVGPPAARNM